MSQFSISKLDCPDIQGYLDDYFSFFANPTQFSFVPLVQFLTSATNLGSVAGRNLGSLKRAVGPGGGKIRTVQIIYTPRYVESAVATSITRDCLSTNEYGHHDVECAVALGTGVTVDETWDPEDLALICRGNGEEFASRMASMLDGLRRKLETEVTDQVVAAVGGFASEDSDVASVKTTSTLKDAATNDLAIEDIGFSRALVGHAQSFVFGSGPIWRYAQRLNAACCNDAGVDFGDLTDGTVFVHSHRVAAAFGDADLSSFLVLAPGASQLVWANLYEGDTNTSNDDSHKLGTINDPMTGLPIDISMTRPCKDWVVQMSLPFTVCNAPTDYFALNDRLTGVNGITEWDVDNS